MTLLSLEGFGVAFADRIVLADVTFDMSRAGLVTLVGPSGSGKSTLLRTLSGLNDAHSSLTTWGRATFDDRRLDLGRTPPGETRPGIGFVLQHAKFYTASVRENLVSALPDRSLLDRSAQSARVKDVLATMGLAEIIPRLEEDVCSLSTPLQRRLAIACALVPEPELLLVDEPTANLEDEDAIDVLALLRAQAHNRAVLFVTHNQRLARLSGGTIVFLAGGRVLETAPAARFFEHPATAAARQFVASGNCGETSPNAQPEQLDSSRPPPRQLPAAALSARSRFEGPRGFFWVLPGKLGGVPRPGIVDDVERDLAGLKRLGVSTLVTLEETMTVPRDLLARFGISALACPVADMSAPELDVGATLAHDVADRLSAGECVAVHCRAGLGRTGTALAAQLIFFGTSARDAIDRIRRINPSCIQSQSQIEFLSNFEIHLLSQFNHSKRGSHVT